MSIVGNSVVLRKNSLSPILTMPLSRSILSNRSLPSILYSGCLLISCPSSLNKITEIALYTASSTFLSEYVLTANCRRNLRLIPYPFSSIDIVLYLILFLTTSAMHTGLPQNAPIHNMS